MNRTITTITAAAALCAGNWVANSAQAQESQLGRLFHSPQERASLDQKRGVIAPVQAAGPQTSVVNGIITRNGQASVLFIDGKESRGPATQASAQQQLNQGVPLKGESGQTIAAKPGQIVDMSSGRTLEVYQLLPGVPETPPRDPVAGTPAAMAPASLSGSMAAQPSPKRIPVPR